MSTTTDTGTETTDQRISNRRGTFVLTAVAFVLWGLVIYYAWSQMLPPAQYGALFLGLCVVYYAWEEVISLLERKDGLSSLSRNELVEVSLLVVVSVVTIVGTVYGFAMYDVLYYSRLGYSLPHERILGLAVILGLGYLTYHTYGLGFFMVLAISIVYVLTGPYWPGLLRHGGFAPVRTIDILLFEFDGFWGNITRIIATWVALFLLYAGLLKEYGAFDLIMRLSFRAATVIESGIAQSAVIASMLIGSINGAQTANAAMTGSITIPLMKESGLRSQSAGAIEAVASSGGQIMPPIMGAAAFLMASFLGIRYVDVLIAGVFPAFIFFVSVAFAVHFTAAPQMRDVTLNVEDHVDDMKSTERLMFDGIKYGVPFAVLLYYLGIAQYTVMTSALYTCLLMIAFGLVMPIVDVGYQMRHGQVSKYVSEPNSATGLTGRIRNTLRYRPVAEFRTQLWNTVEGFKTGAKIIAPITIIVAAINGIVDLFVMTGVPGMFALALMDLSGGVLLIAAIIAMAVCIILGLGMPTVAAYTIVALLIAPAMIRAFMLPDLAAHYFVFYSAILSGLTPPIAIAVVITTGIAGSNFWKTCAEAISIAAPLFVLPFVFLYNPELVVGGATAETFLTLAIVLTGALTMSYGLNATPQMMSKPRLQVRLWILVYTVLGIVIMVHPDLIVNLGAIALAVGINMYHNGLGPWRNLAKVR